MKRVLVMETFHLAANGVTYTKGQEIEVSDELAYRYEGGRFKEHKEPVEKKTKTVKK